MINSAAIEVRNLKKIYKNSLTPAVNTISFAVKKGEIWGLLGPNGAGKTTTISILCGLLQQTSGDVFINGFTHSEAGNQIKQFISIVPQDIALYPTLTAYENLEYVGNMYGMKGEMLKKRIMECLEIFGLTENRNKRIENYSGGMKRRINLIAGILHHPKILFLDEPTVGVDVQSRNIITSFLKKINEEGTTIIYTSHLMEEAQNLCTQISIIDMGTIIANGSPSFLIQQFGCINLEEVFLKLTGRSLRD
ncbi:MAG TPA: ABC transporter ATP-binding protein [Bacteroidia bacterium]|nr:ABC transporter ATP-binding protein [Bacteroidia bacterium]